MTKQKEPMVHVLPSHFFLDFIPNLKHAIDIQFFIEKFNLKDLLLCKT